MILDNASDRNMFASDAYIMQNEPVSVLCLPLLRQANLIGVLYLENNLVRGAFTADRIAVLELLASQAAISLENVSLYLERSRTEHALRQSEEKYRAIFENSGTAVIFMEEDTTILMVNKEFEKLSGFTKAEVQGRMKWTQFLARQDDLNRMKEYHQLSRIDPQAVPQVCEFQVIDREGHLKDVVMTVAMMPGTNQSLSALLDVTELKDAEKALRESEEGHRNLVEHLPQRIFVKDRNSVYLSCNAKYAADLGIVPEQIVGKDDFSFFPPELALAYRADDQACIATAMVKELEEPYPLAGEERWVHTIKVPYRDGQGRVIGVLGIFEE